MFYNNSLLSLKLPDYFNKNCAIIKIEILIQENFKYKKTAKAI